MHCLSCLRLLVTWLSGRLRTSLSREDMPNDPCDLLGTLFREGKLTHQLFLSSAYAAVSGTPSLRSVCIVPQLFVLNCFVLFPLWLNSSCVSR
jgi:hypothetical protein